MMKVLRTLSAILVCAMFSAGDASARSGGDHGGGWGAQVRRDGAPVGENSSFGRPQSRGPSYRYELYPVPSPYDSDDPPWYPYELSPTQTPYDNGDPFHIIDTRGG